MRIAELSARTGTSVPSIKFYLREGLLPPGVATSRNQAEYSEAHVRRLRLIRALIDVGGLSVTAARDVLTAVDGTEVPDHNLLGIAHYALGHTARRDRADPAWQQARQDVLAQVRQRGWRVDENSPNIDRAADAVAAMRALGQEDLLECLPVQLDAVEQIARAEVEAVLRRGDPALMVEGVVMGTILGETIVAALRRLAQEHISATLLEP
jgi:DNA-binding transcriptional MerR regulator